MRTEWLDAAPDTQPAIAARIQARALEVGAYLPLGRCFQPTACRRDLVGVLPGLPLFTNVRRA